MKERFITLPLGNERRDTYFGKTDYEKFKTYLKEKSGGTTNITNGHESALLCYGQGVQRVFGKIGE